MGRQETINKHLLKRDKENEKNFQKQSPFYKWFITFIEEKELDMSEFLTDDIQAGDVCQKIVDTAPKEQEKIKETLVMLDFKNANIYHYFKHLSGALKEKK